MKTTNVRRTVKANEARSPEFTGIQNTKRFTKLKKMIGTTRLRNKKYGFLLNGKLVVYYVLTEMPQLNHN